MTRGGDRVEGKGGFADEVGSWVSGWRGRFAGRCLGGNSSHLWCGIVHTRPLELRSLVANLRVYVVNR